jgi:light-regulated signal transduction histidine kinase (bacteriophytochrome)
MLSPMASAEGTLVTGAIRDISVRKRAEEHLVRTMGELKRSNDELVHFAYVASHDLQEPLRMVASYTQLLAKRYQGRLDPDADEFITYAVDGCNRMQQMIRDLLAYSSVGSSAVNIHPISSESALHAALVNLRTSIEESGAVVTIPPLQKAVAVTQDRSASLGKSSSLKPKLIAPVRSVEQTTRDHESKVIIESELKKTEAKLVDLRMQYAGLSTAQDLDRKLAVKQQIARGEADVVSLKRELK